MGMKPEGRFSSRTYFAGPAQRRALVIILLLFSGLGCAGPGPQLKAPALELRAEAYPDPRDFYRYTPEEFSFSLATLEEKEAFRLHELRYPSPFKSGYPENDLVQALYYEPLEGESLPAVIVLHPIGSGRARLERWICSELAREGFAALLLAAPFHMKRKPRGFPWGGVRMVGEPELLMAAAHQALLDIRRAIDWLAERKRVDGRRLGILGVSMGAIVAELAMGVDERLKAGVFVLGAGDIARLIWESPITFFQRLKLERKGLSEEALRERLALIEPLTFARYIPPRKVFMVNGRTDLVIPPGCAEALWQALGEPPIYWTWWGHYTSYLIKEKILSKSIGFLKENLPHVEEKAAPQKRHVRGEFSSGGPSPYL